MIAKSEPNTEFYKGSYVVITNPKSGEIYSIGGVEAIDNDIYDYGNASMIESVTPGSVVKGASITVGYNTEVIKFGTKMLDACIKLSGTPSKCSWSNLGIIDDLEAIRSSSNVYQYKIAMLVGGFEYSFDKKLIINNTAFQKYRDIFYQYGLGVKTGIDYPSEHIGYKGESTNGELLLNYSIGQYDTYTPLQLVQYISTIANTGKRVKLRFLNSIIENDIINEQKTIVLNTVNTKEEYIKRIQEGMILVMKNGTGAYFKGNVKNSAGKTGTSESYIDINNDGLMDYETISNNFVGYAPYNNPVMSIVVSSPNVQNPNRGSYKSDVNRRITVKIFNTFFDLYDENGIRK